MQVPVMFFMFSVFKNTWWWLVTESCLTLASPRTAALQVPLSMAFPGKSTGVFYHCLLQGIFLTQRSNPPPSSLLPCRRILYPLSHLPCPWTYQLLLSGLPGPGTYRANILHPVTLQVSEDTCYVPLETLGFLKLLYKDRRKDLFLRYNCT